MTQHDDPDDPSGVDPSSSATCPSCGEENPVGSRFCEHCGAEMRAARKRSKRRSRGKQLGRRRANREIGKIANLLKAVRGVYILFACLWGILFLILIAAASASGSGGVDGSDVFWALLMTGSVFLFSILGAAFLYRNPFAWSLAMSCLVSLYVAQVFFAGGIPWLGILMLLICWSATIKIASIKGLLAEFSDTVAAQKLTGTRARVEGGELSTRARLRAANARSRSAPKTAAFVIGGVLVFGLLVVLAARSGQGKQGARPSPSSAADRAKLAKEQLQRERSYDVAIESFVRSWKRSDREAISQLIPEGDWRTLAMKKFVRSLDRYGFAQDKLPPIENRRDLWSRSGPAVKTYFSIPGQAGSLHAKLRMRWEEVDSKWTLTEIGLRKTKRE